MPLTVCDAETVSKRADRGSSATAAALGAALVLSTVAAAANGFGRFAYALVLPPMRADLHWSALTAGLLNAASALGYLIGAAVTDRVAVRAGERTAILGATAVSAVTIAACAATANVPALLALRAAQGVAGAVGFITGGAVVAQLASAHPARQAGRMLGAYFSGPGLGILVSALAIPPLAGRIGWRGAWLVLAALTAGCLLIAGLALRRLPTSPAAASPRRPWAARRMAALVASYGLFGGGYIAYMTFSVAYLREQGRSAGDVVAFWSALGLAGIVISVLLFPRLPARADGRAVAVLLAVVTAGSLLPLLSTSTSFVTISAVLFATFLSITAGVTAAVRHHLPAEQWAPAIAGLTAVFGLGQCVGPVLSGALSDGPSGLRAGLVAGTVLLALSTLVALRQRDPTATAG
jgi:MFS family permease